MSTLTSAPSPTPTPTVDHNKALGQLIIKAQLDDDIRKMLIHNEDLTLNELVLMMQRIFSGKISNSDEITIKYLDDDGDKITLVNDSDLTVALHFHKVLRLFVYVNGNSTEKSAKKEENSNVKESIQIELKDIRQSVQTILERMQTSNSDVSTTVSSTIPQEFDSNKNLQQRSPTPDSNVQSNLNQLNINEHQQSSTIGLTQQTESIETNKTAYQMPTPQFQPATFNNDQQTVSNIFGPPPTAFSTMPTLQNNVSSPYPPQANLNNNAQSAFIGQPTAPPTATAPPLPPPTATQQSGFYAQQQSLFQQRPGVPSFNTNNAYIPQPPQPTSSPATINPSYIQPQAPPMGVQQPYAAYPPQNSYYNPMQQYQKPS